MRIIGSSSVTKLSGSFSVTGPTGPTGPKGHTGPTGSGNTGNTGPSIIGISLVDRSLITYFSNGATYGTSTKIYGTTGPTQYFADFLNLGTGISLIYGVSYGINPFLGEISYQTRLKVRPIVVLNNSNSKFLQEDINEPYPVLGPLFGSSTTFYKNLNLILSSGLTVSTNINTVNFLKFTGNKVIERISNTSGVTVNNDQISPITGVIFNNANVFERVRGGGYTGATLAVYCQQVTGDASCAACGITCAIDPFVEEHNELMFGSKSKVYVLDFSNNKSKITVKSPPIDNKAYSFDLIIKNAVNPPVGLFDRFSSNIKWTQNVHPCFSVDGVPCELRITFFGINGVWYATLSGFAGPTKCTEQYLWSNNCSEIVGLVGNNRNRGDDVDIFNDPNINTLSAILLDPVGACCKNDGTCESVTQNSCSGFFHGPGTTCGTTYDSICNKPGVCCRQSISNGIKTTNVLSDQLTCAECLSLTDQNVKFAGNYTNAQSIDCESLFNSVGACCDGRGGCEYTSKVECEDKGGIFQGNSVSCYDAFGAAICASGTGPCCQNGVCTTQTYSDCFTNNGYYLGKSKLCEHYSCQITNTCSGFIDGVPVYPGARYGGGIVVGSYIPGKSKILGANELFTVDGFTLSDGITYSTKSYTSTFDFYAYGVDETCDELNHSYILIVYPYDIAIDATNSIKNTDTQTYTQNTFAWGSTGSSWGPILDEIGYYNDLRLFDYNYDQTHLKYSEGYWSLGFTGGTQANDPNVLYNTFSSCNKTELYGHIGTAKQFGKSPYNLHGVWYRSWGLYNTIRAVSAINASSSTQYIGSGYTAGNFSRLQTENAFSCIRLLSDGITSTTQGITANNNSLSDWYLPSHDEMAFIAQNTINISGYNLNKVLLLEGQPLNGTYWTSTGSFNYKKQEGIYQSPTIPNPGTVAIAMNIDVNADASNYKVYKADRATKYKVRPIRMIRCDNKIPSELKLWNIPDVNRVY